MQWIKTHYYDKQSKKKITNIQSQQADPITNLKDNTLQKLQEMDLYWC